MNRHSLLLAILCGLTMATPLRAADALDTEISDYKAELGWQHGLCGNIRRPCGYVVAVGGGVVVSTTTQNRTKVVMKKGSARKALNELIKKNPDYVWNRDSGVINILPKPEKMPLIDGKNPLDARVGDLDIKSQPANEALQEIIKASGLPTVGRLSAGGRQHYAAVSLALKNASLKDALNELVKTDGQLSWSIELSPDGKAFVIDVGSWRKGSSLFRK